MTKYDSLSYCYAISRIHNTANQVEDKMTEEYTAFQTLHIVEVTTTQQLWDFLETFLTNID